MANDLPNDGDDDSGNSSEGEEHEVNDGGSGDDQSEAEKEPKSEAKQQRPRKVHKLSLATTQNFNEKLRKRGVIYVARIPPRMTPTKLKNLLGQFGPVMR